MKKVVFALAVLTGSGLVWPGCSQNTPAVIVRSLERSGRAAFLCIRDPTAANPGQELDACFTPGQPPSRFNYGVPHTIALVTQMARGELAIVDVTAATVIDIDPSVPGYNFLPIGQMPTDVVATPAGNASFVGIGDPTRPGIFAIPSSSLPLWIDKKPPTYASWPACALPPGGIPTELVLVPDTTASTSDPGGRRAHCDGSPATPAPTPGTDLSVETEMFGRMKLVAMLPELGELAIIDAQDLLTREPGSFDPCIIERRVFLTVDPTPPPCPPPPEAGVGDATAVDATDPGDVAVSDDGGDVPPEGGGIDEGGFDAGSTDAGAGDDSDGGGTVGDAGPDGPGCTTFPRPKGNPHPYALALADDGRLFISDDSASVIHVVDMRDPCGAEEKLPLLPVSAADPTRAVISGAIAVSPLTSDGQRFVYASDVKNNGSIMVFDVSTTSTERTPLLRQDRLYNPFEPPDRIALAAPVESMTFATNEVPLAKPDPITGVIPRGVPCDPSNPEDPNRPADDFVSAGAAPRRLRGTFAFVALSNGDLSVIDLDDFDAKCRRPRFTDDRALGCYGTDVPLTGLPSASQEVSCKVFERHRVRSASYFSNAEKAGRHAPAMLTFPALYDKDGTALSTDPTKPATARLPKLLGPSLEGHQADALPLMATVLSSTASPLAGLSSVPTEADANWVTFDLRAPRAHTSQVWTVTYEGILPWFAARRGRLQCNTPHKSAIECEQGDDASHLELYDSSVGFCTGGAQGADLNPAGVGDILEIIDDMPDPADPYWTTVPSICSRSVCEEVFGTIAAPRVLEEGRPIGRDIVIEKSYQGRLSLKKSVAIKADRTTAVPVACCFPYPVSYTIRAGQQWIVTGQSSGFAHRLIADTSTETESSYQPCIESPDRNLALRNSRLVARSPSDPDGVPKYDDATPDAPKRMNPDGGSYNPGVFYNAQMRFVLWDMEGTSCDPPPCSGRVRDRFFSFQEVGGFVPMRFALSSSSLILPQSIRYVRGLQMLAIPDPVAMGLMLFSLTRLATTLSLY